ncbi:MAG: hypothetical protein HYS04_12210 [Acidobacteria bacterium]|nr:hypothetical protein [Acidobacteriota bacterium]
MRDLTAQFGFGRRISGFFSKSVPSDLSNRPRRSPVSISSWQHQMLRRTCSTYLAQLTTVKDV